MKITCMNENHIPQIAELEKMCFSSPWSEKALQEELNNPLAVFLVAEEQKVIGYVGCHFVCGEGAITNVCVHTDFRRQGIAKKLLDELVKQGEKLKAETITLEVRKSNLAAIKLYEKMGFAVCGERPNFYTKPTENAVLMAKKIGETL